MFIQRPNFWRKFDVDQHCRVSFLIWNMKHTRKVNKNFDVTPLSIPSFTTKTVKRDGKELETRIIGSRNVSNRRELLVSVTALIRNAWMPKGKPRAFTR